MGGAAAATTGGAATSTDGAALKGLATTADGASDEGPPPYPLFPPPLPKREGGRPIPWLPPPLRWLELGPSSLSACIGCCFIIGAAPRPPAPGPPLWSLLLLLERPVSGAPLRAVATWALMAESWSERAFTSYRDLGGLMVASSSVSSASSAAGAGWANSRLARRRRTCFNEKGD